MTRYLRTEAGHHYFDFVCPGCGGEGELGLRTDDFKPFGCPEGCGATFVMWRPDKNPAIRCVVQPVFAKQESTSHD